LENRSPAHIKEILSTHGKDFHQVVPFGDADRLLRMDFTECNPEWKAEILNDTRLFTQQVNKKLADAGARYGIGGYAEHRPLYIRSRVFDGHEDEPRRLHLGIDIWGKPYTAVMAPLDGIVHSFAFNNAFGDYGATIILSHQLEGCTFYTLYGHLSLNSLTNLQEGMTIRRGDVFAQFGIPFENGQWPPHLHFQIIIDMEGRKGDYPGVCKYSEKEQWLRNSPDPDLILNMMGRARGSW
jgi:peptidoglycan LD-endopeptidase LytH